VGMVGPAWGAGIPLDETRGVYTLAPVLEATAPAIVSVVATGVVRNSVRTVATAKRGQSEGSGVIVDAAKGYILTSNHVVNGATSVVVMLHDGRALEAKLIGGDVATDIAVLRISPVELTAVPLGDPASLRVGDFVIAIGNPFGLGQSVTSGIISALGRGGLNADRHEDFIQTDASINPGNSGGALIDTAGRLIGINAAIYGPPNGALAIGISFSVPIDIARAVMDQLITYGDIKRGRLGVAAADLTPTQAARFGRVGALIKTVEFGSTADRAGLAVNDVVLAVNGTQVRNARDLNNRVSLTRAGQAVRLSVLRDGKSYTVDVPVTEAL
jgi:serine protease DegQ